MRNNCYLTLFALCFMLFSWQCSHATNYAVNSLIGNGSGSLEWALSNVNSDKTATADNPHVVEILVGGEATLSPLPQQHCTINCPKNMSLKLSGVNYNLGTLLRGIHITINNAVFDKTNNNSDFGSALSARSGATFSINECLFINNAARYQGGAVFSAGDTVYLYGCTFKNNSTTNSAGGGGAAVFNGGGYMLIANCTFSGNTSVALNTGGGAVANSGEMEILNCKFYDNRSANTGGAIDNHRGFICRLSNNIFAGNSAANNGNELTGEFVAPGAYNHFENNTAAFVCGVTNGNNPGIYRGNIEQAPNTVGLNPAREFTIVTCDGHFETTEVYSVAGNKIVFVKGQITKINASAIAQGL